MSAKSPSVPVMDIAGNNNSNQFDISNKFTS